MINTKATYSATCPVLTWTSIRVRGVKAGVKSEDVRLRSSLRGERRHFSLCGIFHHIVGLEITGPGV